MNYDYYISVIVPIYNKEKYLKTTLDSIVDQTIFNNIQVICVDDNSTDKSLDILKEYNNKYKNFLVIHSDYNGKYLTNLKRSLPFIKGKYSIILEADDWIDKTLYQELYEEIEKLQYDTVETNNVINHYNDKIILDKKYNDIDMDIKDLSVMNKGNILTGFCYRNWCKLTKSSIFIKALSLYTDEKINCITDDVFISIGILYYSNSYKIYRTKSLIHYNIKDDTQHNSRTNWNENNEKTKFYRINNILNTLDSKAYNLLMFLYGNQFFSKLQTNTLEPFVYK